MKLTLALLLCILMLGCASEPLTESQIAEREYERAERAEQWRLCEATYQQAGLPTYSEHSHSKGRRHRPHEISQDLALNNCREILRRTGLWEY